MQTSFLGPICNTLKGALPKNLKLFILYVCALVGEFHYACALIRKYSNEIYYACALERKYSNEIYYTCALVGKYSNEFDYACTLVHYYSNAFYYACTLRYSHFTAHAHRYVGTQMNTTHANW